MTADPADAGTPARSQTRDFDRKRKILHAARRLFRERGYHAVGMDHIGAAAGISGPGVYRHFDCKEDLLVSVIDEVATQWSEAIHEAGTSPTIEALVRSHVRFAVANSDLIALWNQESRNLPTAGQSRQRALQRRYIEEWVGALLEQSPELTESEARIRVRLGIGLIHSVAYTDGFLDRDRLEALMTSMAVAAIGAALLPPRESILNSSA